MIGAVIRWSLKNRTLVLLLAFLIAGAGIYSIKHIALDALPDLSDVQVIVRTPWPGQTPQVVEDQVTYPLTTAMLAVPRSTYVRGFSFFGESLVYVIFEDGTDPYWARSRVLEYLNQVQGQLPEAVRPRLGPDATGVGWVYEYALVDRTGQHSIAELTTLQNWTLKFALQTVPGVAEVATVGGMVKQYQVVLDPNKLRAYGVTLGRVKRAIERGNSATGGSVIELGEAEYMIRATGYVQSIGDLKKIPVMTTPRGTPVLLKDLVTTIRTGPEQRRGVAELNGKGQVVGGIVIMRYDQNALAVIEAVKAKLAELQTNLPAGVEIVTTYDRSKLIHRAVNTLNEKLIEEFIVVVLVCALFLWHLRSSLVVLASLPLGILTAFIVMYWQGINANIMSLGGIAIAIGAMVDAAIVMIENVHKHLEHEPPPDARTRWRVVERAVMEVGPSLFFSLVIVAVSFVPVFALQGQAGRLFAPLAFTKTYAMAAAAGLSVTLVPVLMGYFIRGRIVPEAKNPLNRALIAAYAPAIRLVERHPWPVLAGALVIVVATAWPLTRLGSEFMPELNEGTLLYMPTTLPGISIGKAAQLLQQTDKLIATVPEVKRVFGKAGRADTATDAAPLNMFETTVQLKPKSEWRPGMTMDKLIAELNRIVQIPGLSNAWVMPIQNRINMLATGVKTSVGVKIMGPDLAVIERIGTKLEDILREVPGTTSVFAERTASARYITVDIDRLAAARVGLNIADVHNVVETAIGGMNIGTSIQGRKRFPINLRYPADWRDSLARLRELPIVTATGAVVPLSQVADIEVEQGPGMIKTEDAQPTGLVFIDIADRDLGSYVADAQRAVADQLDLPAGYSLVWSGEFRYMQQAIERLKIVVPATLALIFLLLFLNFRRLAEPLIIMTTLPLALVGGIWLLWALDYNLSVAVGVGFIALAGIASEIGVVMLVYLNQALADRKAAVARENRALTLEDLREAIRGGALRRVRPVIMTVAAIVAGLAPIMLGHGTGDEVMRRIAAPMVGGIVSATVLALLVVPAVYYLWQKRIVQTEKRSQP